MERLLNEENTKSSYTERSDLFSCTDGFVTLDNVEVFKSRKVSRCHFAPTDSAILLTMHSEPSQVSS